MRRSPVPIKQKNIMRIDPTKTGIIRRAFIADIKRRFRKLKRDVWEFMVVLDALGISPRVHTTWIGITNVQPREYEFRTNPQKVAVFRQWLTDRIAEGLLEVDDRDIPWLSKYIEQSFRKGEINAFFSSKKGGIKKSEKIDDFLKEAFARPETLDKIKLLLTRSFEGIKGLTESMKSELGQILAQGLVDKSTVKEIAGEIEDVLGLSESRAYTIARTEIVNAHAEGQLDAFEELGIDELGLKAEWATAGDDRVCEECSENEGILFTVDEARGMIPLHPNCRCAWIPAEEKKGKKKK
jgi:SPP1 gp7 family putative phage head morphogenesis protein